MTFEELNAVRELKTQIAEKEQTIETLKLCAESITPKIDGLPRGTTKKSRIENVSCMIADAENSLKDLYNNLEEATMVLICKIDAEYKNPTEKKLLVGYYVACQSLNQTARMIRRSWRQTCRIHERILKNVI